MLAGCASKPLPPLVLVPAPAPASLMVPPPPMPLSSGDTVGDLLTDYLDLAGLYIDTASRLNDLQHWITRREEATHE
ncbi:MAG: Rz1-like lysis system protein LysC [Halothiobacillus sp.]